MNNLRCKICLGVIDGEEMDFHAACCHRLFGSAQPPQLPYSWAALNSMAEQIVRSHVAALRFFEVNLFSFLTGNSDMHLKNFSLIRSQDGEIRFSPAYDLLPTVLLLPEDTEESALTIQGRKKRLTLRDFFALGNALGLTDRQISNALRRFEKGLSAAIPLIRAGFCSEEMKARYQELVERRWERLQETTASD